nr:MAG: hypothetical protein [Gammatorquevirus sp.]
MNNLTAIDFYKPPPYNTETLNQIWMSQISDSHDIWCNCNGPFAHLLASIFPPGHKDRDLTVSQIIKRDYKQSCLSGGKEEEGPGLADGGTASAATAAETRPIEGEEEDYPGDEIEHLLAAAIEESAR